MTRNSIKPPDVLHRIRGQISTQGHKAVRLWGVSIHRTGLLDLLCPASMMSKEVGHCMLQYIKSQILELAKDSLLVFVLEHTEADPSLILSKTQQGSRKHQFSMLNWLRNVIKCALNYIPEPIKLVFSAILLRLHARKLTRQIVANEPCHISSFPGHPHHPVLITYTFT